MHLLFVIDPIGGLKPYKDSSVAMMQQALQQGHQVSFTTKELLLASYGRNAPSQLGILAECTELQHIDITAANWCQLGASNTVLLQHFDAVLMRSDPPFDQNYCAALWLLQQAERHGAKVVNRPQAILTHSEKLALLEFPDLAPPMCVASDAKQLQAFWAEQQDIIVKPLFGMGGQGIFRLPAKSTDHDWDHNFSAIVESMNGQPIMAQRYIPEVVAGDKRVLIIGGKVLPIALARVPEQGATRANMAAGGKPHAQPISKTELAIAEKVAETLTPRGLYFIGIDIIGDYLTEINVTSPTGLVEIFKQTGIDGAAQLITWLAQNHH